jgi:hypothetical protein
MVKAFFGDDSIQYALLYDQLGSFPSLAVYGTLIVSLYGSGEGAPAPRALFRRVVTFPPFIALLVALAIGRSSYPAPVENVLTMISSALVPLVMIAVGFQLQLRMGKGHAGLLTLGLAMKMVAAPLLALAICRMAGLEGDAVKVAVFEAGMPPMVSAGALAIAAGLAPPLTAAFVGVGIVASFVTLPLLHQLL